MPNRSQPSRRDMLRGASIGAAALAFPSIVTSRALGQERAAAPATAASARLNVGFIGIGKQASGHLNNLAGRPNIQVLAVCDVNSVRRDAAQNVVRQKYEKIGRAGEVKAYVDYRELLARKDIDAVVIGTPDHWHTIPVIEAAKAKKDIYCEKPLTLTIHEAKACIDAVRKHEVVFQTGSQQRSGGPFRQACEVVRSGRLGKIKEVLVGIGPTSKMCDLPEEPVDPNTNWEMWIGQAPMRPYNEILCHKGLPDSYPFLPGWRDYTEFSGGQVTDWGAHHFDITQWALDMDGSGPAEVIPPEKPGDKYGAKLIYRGSPAGDEITVTHVNKVYEVEQKNKEGKLEKKWEGNGILFIGEAGKLFVNRSTIVSDPEPLAKEPIAEGSARLFKSPGHFENWFDCIKTRQRPLCDVEVGARSVTVCHLTNLAYWHGKRLRWDAKAWEFTGENAAEGNKWRDRERRGPYQLPTI